MESLLLKWMEMDICMHGIMIMVTASMAGATTRYRLVNVRTLPSLEIVL